MKNITICSLARSGHHAIIFWILNNLVEEFTDVSDELYYINKQKGVYYFNDISAVSRSAAYTYPSEYQFLFKSYEDVSCCEDTSVIYKNSDTVYIVRDFINLLCSRYKKRIGARRVLGHRGQFKSFQDLIDIWKFHVSKFFLTPEKCIIYNKWLTDKDYRNIVSETLGIKNTVDNINYVPPMGNGSSYILNSRESDIQNYNLRYKLTDLPLTMLATIFKDRELIELNKSIFNLDLEKIFTTHVTSRTSSIYSLSSLDWSEMLARDLTHKP